MKILKNIFKVILIVLIVFIGIEVCDGYKMYRNAIETVPIMQKAEDIRAKKNYTKLSEMPEIYLDAVVAVEDHRFYTHKGIDLISITRAILTDISTMRFVEGGSTITQQLCKNAYFTQEKKMTRKIAEVFMALKIEKYFTKSEILELYLNTSYFGAGCYTVKDAARVYFNKLPIEMNDYESTMLAGIPNAPSVYAPTVNPELAKERQRQVIQKMLDYKVIEKKKASEILESQ